MLVSTFELLVKPQIPAEFDPSGVGRVIVQGYFLTISNLNSFRAALKLTFTATTPSINLDELITLLDISGGNTPSDLSPTSDPRKFTFRLVLPANDTALLILQPDVTKQEILKNANTELRGYVEVAMSNRVVFPDPPTVPIPIPPFPGPVPGPISPVTGGTPQETVMVLNPSQGDFLLTPEQRGTFIPKDLNNPSRDLDQIAYSLPTANGGSLFRLSR